MVHIFQHSGKSFVFEDQAATFWTCDGGGWRIVEDQDQLEALTTFFNANRSNGSIVTPYEDMEAIWASLEH